MVYSTLTIDNCICQWQPRVKLSNDSALSWVSSRCIAANGNNVHTVWHGYYVCYKHSTDAGMTWGPVVHITNVNAHYWLPSVAVSDSTVHVVFYLDDLYGYELYYNRSTDNGLTWGTNRLLSSDIHGIYYPVLAANGSSIHLSWQDERSGEWEIYYKRSTNGGITWEPDSRLTYSGSSSWHPNIAISNSVIHIVWYDYRDSKSEIYYKRSTDGGATWENDMRLSNLNASANAGYPNIAASGSLVYVAWQDSRDGNYEIYYKRSTDAGLSWGADTRLTNFDRDSWYPNLSAVGSKVHIVWQDRRGGFTTELYYKRSNNGGLNWSTDTCLISYPVTSENPNVAVSGSAVHILFKDDGFDTPGIYYKGNSTGNLIGIISVSNEAPSSYELQQNYPNPFNNITKFKIQISKLSSIKLVLSDIYGRQIKTLVSEKLNTGIYIYNYDGSGISSGIYYYTLFIDGKRIDTKKMVMIK